MYTHTYTLLHVHGPGAGRNSERGAMEQREANPFKQSNTQRGLSRILVIMLKMARAFSVGLVGSGGTLELVRCRDARHLTIAQSA
jgi:hypothetical protein